METKILVGIIICSLLAIAISKIIGKISTLNKKKRLSLVIDKAGVQTYRGKVDNGYGRYKVTLLDGTKRTVVGNISTILEVNDVVDYYEIK